MARSAGPKAIYRMMSRVLHSMLRCVTITPLGVPVEPEVNMSAARSLCGSIPGMGAEPANSVDSKLSGVKTGMVVCTGLVAHWLPAKARGRPAGGEAGMDPPRARWRQGGG